MSDPIVGSIVNIDGHTGKCLHVSYQGDPIAFWVAENKWKDKELKYLLAKLEDAENENAALRIKLYCRDKKRGEI